MKIKLVFLLFCCGLNSLWSQGLMDHQMTYGKFQVGFKSIKAFDLSRPSLVPDHSAPGRAMQMYVWYPVDVPGKSQMTYQDYLSIQSPDQTFSSSKKVFYKSLSDLGGDTTLFEPVFESLAKSKVKAFKDASVAKGEFPLVIYSDQVHLQQLMCEYLASHGYIVVSPGLQGTYSPAMEYNLIGVETGVVDLSFTLGYMRSHFKVTQNFAVMGIGFNATIDLALQMRNPDAAAMISLEGGITTGFEEALIQRSPFYNLQKITGSMLIIHAPHPDVKPELTYKYKYAEKVYQSYPQSSEFYFLNYGIWERSLKNILPKANKGNTWSSFEIAAQSVHLYLDWKLKTDEKSKSRLFKNDWPADLVQTSIRPAVPLPPGLNELTTIWQNQGMDSLRTIYQTRKEFDDQPFDFSTFFQLSQQMVSQGKYQDLLSWASLFADTYPETAVPHSLQGRAHLELNNKTDAKWNYEKALSLLDKDAELNDGEKKFYKQAIENRINSLN